MAHQLLDTMTDSDNSDGTESRDQHDKNQMRFPSVMGLESHVPEQRCRDDASHKGDETHDQVCKQRRMDSVFEPVPKPGSKCVSSDSQCKECDCKADWKSRACIGAFVLVQNELVLNAVGFRCG